MKTYIKTIITTVALVAIFVFAQGVQALEYQGRLIKKGVQGPDVRAVQQCLLDMGFALPVYGADGWYGQETYVQITSYQVTNNLMVDGVVGPQTAAALDCKPVDATPIGIEIEDLDIEDIDIDVQKDTIAITLTGTHPNGCYVALTPTVDYDNTLIRVTAQQEVDTTSVCTMALVDYDVELEIDISNFEPGDYEIQINKKNDFEFEIESDSTIPKKVNNSVRTSAEVISTSGDDNDTAQFSFKFDLNAFGNEVYLSENAENSVSFRVLDASDGSTVFNTDGSVENGEVIFSLSTNADSEGDFYRIDEDMSEEFEVLISYNPYAGVPAGSGSYRIQLDSMNYTTGSAAGTAGVYQTSSLTRFRTKSVNIVN